MAESGDKPRADWDLLLEKQLPDLVLRADERRLVLLHQQRPSDAKLYVHGHPEICFLLEGELVVESTETTLSLAPGSILVVAPGTYHLPRSRDHSALTVWFAGALDHMAGILSRTFREGHWISLGGFDLLEFGDSRRLLDETVRELSGTGPGKTAMARALILTLCIRALRKMQAPGDAAGERTNRGNEIALQAKRFIRGNFIRPLTLTDVAHHVALSPNYLANLFNRQFGTTIRQYLTEVRMEEAKRLLLESSLSISEIGYAVGYHSPFYFSRAFRSTERVSPSEYRESGGTANPAPPDEQS